MRTLLFLLVSCKGCDALFFMPGLPSGSGAAEEPPPFDTAVDDDWDESDTGEALPPPQICANMEVEPNDAVGDEQPLPLEQWMCGYFGDLGDNDGFIFDIDRASWVRIRVRAEALGSPANPRAFLYDEDGEFEASLEDSYLTSDIDTTFKLDEPRELAIGILEQESGTVQFGEDYEWRLMVSIVKAPIEWNAEELEPNDGRADANPVADGDRMFGRIEHGARYDWYQLEVAEGRTDVVIETDSWIHGSPLNPEIMIEGPDGEEVDRADEHDSSANWDAKVAFTATEPGLYKIRVGTCCEGDTTRTGGLPKWYVLNVSAKASATEDDTGSGD